IHEMGIMTQSSLVRRRVLERVGPFQEGLYVADYEFWLRAAWAGCRFRYCPGALAFYRSRSGQMSADTPAMLRRIREVLERALAAAGRGGAARLLPRPGRGADVGPRQPGRAGARPRDRPRRRRAARLRARLPDRPRAGRPRAHARPGPGLAARPPLAPLRLLL